MVSFRLSWEEYNACRDACDTVGVRSLSELARAAMQHLLSSHHNGASLNDEVNQLRSQVSLLSREVERIARHVDRQEESTAHAKVGSHT